NLQGIYSRPLENFLIEKIKEDHHWDFVQANTIGPVLSPMEMEHDPAIVRQVSQGLNADAFLVAKVTKGPNGVALRLDLFLVKDALLLAQAEVSNLQQFDIKSLQEQTLVLWSRIQSQLPYQGRVLSRQGTRVTVNLGKRDGITNETIINAVQILKLKRHPKFNFLVGSEKEIIGKIKILKVDETLSFGRVILEKEKGAIGKHTKLAGLDSVSYPASGSLSASDSGGDPLSRADSEVSFGKNPTAWVPKRPPTFGQVGARLGLGQYAGNMSLTGVGSLNSSNGLYPSVTLDGEIWITPDWTAHARLTQGIIPVSNPRSGSSPGELSQSLTETDLSVGYTFHAGPSIWDSRVEALIGFAKYRLYTDDSTARGFTTMDFSGLKFGAKGSTPVTEDNLWSAGAYIFFFWNPVMKESPVSSGDDNDATINQFGLLCGRKLSEHLRLEASLDFAIYSAKFSGAGSRAEPATSASHRHTSLAAGIYYLF
ncbi:MAG: hypothetical protein KDD43_12490, partial [Bdellovibrionales bacterium]|nr:hypothetical protein [Bdellovibrionales bacterium]